MATVAVRVLISLRLILRFSHNAVLNAFAPTTRSTRQYHYYHPAPAKRRFPYGWLLMLEAIFTYLPVRSLDVVKLRKKNGRHADKIHLTI